MRCYVRFVTPKAMRVKRRDILVIEHANGTDRLLNMLAQADALCFEYGMAAAAPFSTKKFAYRVKCLRQHYVSTV